MIKQARDFKASRSGTVLRMVQYQGREHIVVPVVALVEGVIHASNAPTPELVLSEEFAKSLQQWNGRPVMLDHPKVSDEQVSANDPKILEQYQIGTVFNAKVDGDKLKMEAWLDPTKMEGMGDEAKKMLASVRAGEMVEVSVGTYVVAENKKGRLGDKDYSVIWRDISSDHLAFLPAGTTGACSIEMGCGAPRAAGGPGSGPQKGGGSGKEKNPNDQGGEYPSNSVLLDNAPGKHTKEAVSAFNNHEISDPQSVQAFDDAEADAVQAGRSMGNQELADEFRGSREEAIFRGQQLEKAQGAFDRERGSFPLTDPKKGEKLSREKTKTAKALGQMAGLGRHVDHRGINPFATRLNSEIEVQARAAGCGCGGSSSINASAEDGSMDKKARVAAIIASGKTCFKAADAAVLEQLSDEAIKALEDKVAEPKVEAKVEVTPTPEEFLAANPEIKAIVDAAKSSAALTPAQKQETFLKDNPDIAEIVSTHKAAAAAKRTELVGKLKTAQKAYTEAELQVLPLDQLEKLASIAIQEKPDFSGRGPARAAAGQEEGVPAAPDMKARILEMRKASA